MPDALGISLFAFLLLGLIWGIFHPRPGMLSLLTLIVATLLSMTLGHPSLMYRYAINPLLIMALLGGILIADLVELASNWSGSDYSAWLAVGMFALLLTPSVISDLQLNRLLNQSDTRAIARTWILNHIPPKTVIAATAYDPVWNSYGEPQLPANCRFVPLGNFDSLRARGIRWVFSDSLSGLDQYSPGPTAAEQKDLDSQATLVLDISPIKEGAPPPVFDPSDAFYVPFQHLSSMRWPGPRIRIWMINPGR